MVYYSSHPAVGQHAKNDELWLAFSIARLFGLITQEHAEAEFVSTIGSFYPKRLKHHIYSHFLHHSVCGLL